jgi:hypothetical protein
VNLYKWSSRNLNFAIVGLSILIYASVLRPSFKYLDTILFGIIYIVLITLVLLNIHRILKSPKIIKILENNLFWLGILFLYLLLTIYFYPLADGLKVNMGGWDQDDCLILGVNNLFTGDNPYKDSSYFGNPCSPGFGALAIYAPFIAVGLTAITPIIWMIFVQMKLRSVIKANLGIGVFIVIYAASPMTLELMVNGSDILVMGFGILLIALSLETAESSKTSKSLILPAVLVGLIGSMRVNMLLILLIAGIYVIVKFGKRSWIFIFITSVLALIPSVIIYLTDPTNFTPLHLVGKSQVLVPSGLYVVMILLTLAGVVAGTELVRRKLIHLADFLLISFSPHIVFLAFTPLIFGGWDFYNWEAGHYLFVITPLCSYLLMSTLLEKINRLFKNVS